MLPVVSALVMICGTTIVCVAPSTRFASQFEIVGIVLFISGLAAIGVSLARFFT